jgi:hypothetical protein
MSYFADFQTGILLFLDCEQVLKLYFFKKGAFANRLALVSLLRRQTILHAGVASLWSLRSQL